MRPAALRLNRGNRRTVDPNPGQRLGQQRERERREGGAHCSWWRRRRGFGETTSPETNLKEGWWSYGACESALVTGEELPPAAEGATRFSTATSYDCYLGQPLSFTDINGVTTSFEYGAAGAAMDRLRKVTKALGEAEEAATNYSYSLELPEVWRGAKSASRTSNDEALQSRTVFDGLGRAVSAEQYDGTAWVKRKVDYDGLNRAWKTYIPASGDPTIATVTKYDGLGRVKRVTAPDGAVTTY